MANGSHKIGPAQADRIREKYSQRGRWHDEAIARAEREHMTGAPRSLPPYGNDDAPAEITGSWTGIGAKLGLPRRSRQAIGFALAALILAVSVLVVVHAVRMMR